MRLKDERGQAMAEFALMIPVLILLLFGMTFAAFYAFRSASTDWGVFITGVATGSYNTPATEQARKCRALAGPGRSHQRRREWSAPGAFPDLGGRLRAIGSLASAWSKLSARPPIFDCGASIPVRRLE